MTAKWGWKRFLMQAHTHPHTHPQVLDAGTGSFEYYIKIVPTKFHYLHSSEVVDTNQYSGIFFFHFCYRPLPEAAGFHGRSCFFFPWTEFFCQLFRPPPQKKKWWWWCLLIVLAETKNINRTFFVNFFAPPQQKNSYRPLPETAGRIPCRLFHLWYLPSHGSGKGVETIFCALLDTIVCYFGRHVCSRRASSSCFAHPIWPLQIWKHKRTGRAPAHGTVECVRVL